MYRYADNDNLKGNIIEFSKNLENKDKAKMLSNIVNYNNTSEIKKKIIEAGDKLDSSDKRRILLEMIKHKLTDKNSNP